MGRENYNDLLAFIAVAREGSFTRAAAQMGVSQSALSHTIRALEARLGVRLLTRTTRSVSATEAGERLALAIGPRFEEIESELAALTELKDKPAGSIRITAAEHAANTVLWPRLHQLTAQYPDINVEITVDYGLTDIVAGRYDAGVRLGDQVEKDMIAVRIGPDLRMVVVGAPAYLAGKTLPRTPADLAQHNCINLRLPTRGGLMAWELERDGHPLKARVQGQWTFNSSAPILRAALAGCGVAYVPEDMAAPYLAGGELKHLLKAWTPTFPGYHLYYASRRQSSPAFGLVVDALRYDGARSATGRAG
ncbi:LysR family transcriptional regulator [Herbaspirillum robiniae]|uniref:LysR family transcriptional regulator n=1 Tax=Herbaspirillum robiniae TaxID=2014887 RepID=A0ABX2LUL9_9BURK|nr:LysR family transcriptional regulator [Herbaspirillum robiniae]NUU01433.1 LysR family transcriptional regulator [Herbaspirillum robiniae]